MNTNLESSIGAFNVSKNCDRSSPENFYQSYITRKKLIIASKLHAAQAGGIVNQKKLEWEIFITKLAIQEKEAFLRRAAKLLQSSPDTIQNNTLQRATELVEGLL